MPKFSDYEGATGFENKLGLLLSYIDFDHETLEKPIKIQTNFKLYAIRMSYSEPDPIKRLLILRMITLSYLANLDLKHLDPKDIILSRDYNNPYNYTDHTNYMNDYMEYRIRSKFGISFQEYIDMDLVDFKRMTELCKLMKENEPTEEDFSKELEDYKESVEDGF